MEAVKKDRLPSKTGVNSITAVHIQMADPKRVAFRKYLESAGVLEVLNRAMTALQGLEEKPENPLAFVRENIGAPPCEDVDALIRENQDLNARVYQLRREIAALEAK